MRITPHFKEKLQHNFHELTILEMFVYFICIRPFWNKEKRFFFEGSLPLLGQMYVAERKLLFDTIIDNKPRHCFEIGTYTGGGSTYFLAKAFEKLGKGKLITMEIDPYYYHKAKNYFTKKIPKVGKHIDFILGDKANKFDSSIASYGTIDCVFLDGEENGEQTLDQYNYFLPYFRKGTILILHDWKTEKTRKIKPVIDEDKNWEIITILGLPESVGMAVFKRK